MYPTWAAAGRRAWRCPACALWIALLLQSVLKASASGESPNHLSFLTFFLGLCWLSVPVLVPPDARHSTDVTRFRRFGDAVCAPEHTTHPQTSARLKTPVFPLLVVNCVVLAHPNRVCHHLPPLSSCKSIVVFEIIAFFVILEPPHGERLGRFGRQ